MIVFTFLKCFYQVFWVQLCLSLNICNVLIGVFVFSIFFLVRFLVFELWSLLCFTVVNSVLGLGEKPDIRLIAKYAVDANQ